MISLPLQIHISLAPCVFATSFKEHLLVKATGIDGVQNSHVQQGFWWNFSARSAVQETHLNSGEKKKLSRNLIPLSFLRDELPQFSVYEQDKKIWVRRYGAILPGDINLFGEMVQVQFFILPTQVCASYMPGC